MDFDIIKYLLIGGVIQGFGFNLVTLFIKKKFSKVIVFLNLIVLFISLNNLQRILTDIKYFEFNFLLNNLLVPWYLFIIPMFYAFTAHFLRIEKKVKDFTKITVIIFVSEMVIRLILISYEYHYVYNEFPVQAASQIKWYTNFIEEPFNLIFSLFLFVNACLLVFRKNKLLEFIMEYDDLKWLKLFIKLGSFVVIFWIMTVVLRYFNIDCQQLLHLGSSIYLYWIGYQGFYKYNVVEDRIFLRKSINANRVLISPETKLNIKKQTDDFYNKKHENDFLKIRNHIIEEKLYLDPLLSMENTANELGMSKSYFSKLINSFSNYNFSDFINSLRVEQAKKFLSDDEFSQYTIVAIGLECGFNSKSTFYSAFKKFTSETPTSYRAQF